VIFDYFQSSKCDKIHIVDPELLVDVVSLQDNLGDNRETVTKVPGSVAVMIGLVTKHVSENNPGVLIEGLRHVCLDNFVENNLPKLVLNLFGQLDFGRTLWCPLADSQPLKVVMV
jgi:hypothetical protein